jgi:hypothetical protein
MDGGEGAYRRPRRTRVPLSAKDLGGGLGAKLVEGARQLLSDHWGRSRFDRRALHQVDELAIAQDGDGRRCRWMTVKIGTRPFGGLAVLSRKDRDRLIG